MPTWPSTLPKPAISGYQVAPVDQTVRSDMEVGAARVRRRTAARNDQVTASWMLTDTQMSAFRTWFDDPTQAAGGSAWFDGLSLPIGTGGSAACTCRFIGPFTAALADKLAWKVTAKLEIR